MQNKIKVKGQKQSDSFYVQNHNSNNRSSLKANEDSLYDTEQISTSFGIDIDWTLFRQNGGQNIVTLKSIKIKSTDGVHEILPILGISTKQLITLRICDLNDSLKSNELIIHKDVSDSIFNGGHIECISEYLGGVLAAADTISRYGRHCDYIEKRTI